MSARPPLSSEVPGGPARRLLAWFRGPVRRLSDESGVALVIALSVTLVLTITVTAVLTYTGADSRDASRSSAAQKAYALAEAGLADGLAVVEKAGTDTTNVKPQPQYAGDSSSYVTTFASGGTATWGGSYDASSRTWTIKAIGSVPNPTGPSASSITRTLTQTAGILPPPYSFVALNSNCEHHALLVRASGQLTVTNAMYVNSCNAPQDAFDIFGPGGNISAPSINVVGGWETHDGDTVTVNGVTCPLSNSSAPLTAQQPTGCPTTGQPVVSDPFAGKLNAPTLGGPACTGYGNAVSYSPKQNLVGNIDSTQTTITTNGTAIQNGDAIRIDNEQMLVTAGGGTSTLTVTRGQYGTSAASHSNGKEVKYVTVTGTAASPAPCEISSGTVTLQPGTYYGGICIGGASGKPCGSVVGGQCTTSGTSPNVTLAPGTYIMAGGGFFVCGAATLSAPNILIYNTQDPSNTSGSGAIDQIALNTTGHVTLGAQGSGAYQGLTIFEDPNLAVAGNTACDGRKTNQEDIALESMDSSGANGALGSVSGTIYAPAVRTLFADSVSGTANLAVLTSCILIDGGNSTFDFQTSGLYGVDWAIGPESG